MDTTRKTKAKLKITIYNLRGMGSIADAIEELAREHDTIASGVIGPQFATSGPGSGWTRNFSVRDYALRALDGGYGALSYVDSSDGLEATLNDEGELEWSDEPVVEIILPDASVAARYPKELAVMVRDGARYCADQSALDELAREAVELCYDEEEDD